MARAIVGLCAAPGVVVVAEGVETSDELSLVRGVGCTAVQGFVFSKPLLAEQAARLVGPACEKKSDEGRSRCCYVETAEELGNRVNKIPMTLI